VFTLNQILNKMFVLGLKQISWCPTPT